MLLVILWDPMVKIRGDCERRALAWRVFGGGVHSRSPFAFARLVPLLSGEILLHIVLRKSLYAL